MERGERDAISMSEDQRPRPSVGQMFWWGFVGHMLAIAACLLLTEIGGYRLIQLAQDMNAWVLMKMGYPFNTFDPKAMLGVQIAGVGFALGMVLCWYRARGGSEK